jgi:hypothetical protein
VELLSTNINARGNPLLALSSSKLLNLALERGGGKISKQFDDGTLLKSQMLTDLVWNGDVDPKVALDTVNSIFHDARSRDHAINLNAKLRGSMGKQDRLNLFGTDVDERTYGVDGVGMYEDLVRDFFITNGGDGKSARKVAKARLDATYSYPRHGYYRQRKFTCLIAKNKEASHILRKESNGKSIFVRSERKSDGFFGKGEYESGGGKGI